MYFSLNELKTIELELRNASIDPDNILGEKERQKIEKLYENLHYKICREIEKRENKKEQK